MRVEFSLHKTVNWQSPAHPNVAVAYPLTCFHPPLFEGAIATGVHATRTFLMNL